MKVFQKITILVAIAIIFASCEEKKDPIEVVKLADSVSMSIKSAEFDIIREYKDNQNSIKDTVKIQIKRRSLDLDPLGFSIRYEYKNGMIATFNGLEYRYIVPEEKKVVIADTADKAFRILAGNWITGAVHLILTNYSNIEDMIASKDSLKNLGAEVYKDEKTFRISFNKMYEEYGIYSKDVVNYSINDGLPRRYSNNSYMQGDSIFREYRYSNIKINPELSDDLFSLKVPEGYSVENFEAPSEQGSMPSGAMMPSFELKDINGKMVNSSSFKGKVMVLDFWGTWCKWCVTAMPKLQELHKKYEKNKKVEVLGISCSEPENAEPKKFLAEHNATYNSLLLGDEVARSFSVNGFPTLFVIGKDGRIVHTKSGFSEDMVEELSKIIDAELEK